MELLTPSWVGLCSWPRLAPQQHGEDELQPQRLAPHHPEMKPLSSQEEAC